MKTVFTFPAAKAKAATIFAGVRDIRHYLNGVHFQRAPVARPGEAGMVAIATDGHRLTAIYDAAGMNDGGTLTEGKVPVVGFGVTIPTDLILAAVKANGKPKDCMASPLVIEVEDSADPATARRVRIIANFGAARVEDDELGGKSGLGNDWLDWQRVVPDAGECNPTMLAPAAYNADYLADYTKLHAVLGSNGYRPAFIQARGASAAIVDVGNADVLCVLMPMRSDCVAALPGWFA